MFPAFEADMPVPRQLNPFNTFNILISQVRRGRLAEAARAVHKRTATPPSLSGPAGLQPTTSLCTGTPSNALAALRLTVTMTRH